MLIVRFIHSETPYLCRFLALLNKVGFPRLKLYNLVQEIAEGYCLPAEGDLKSQKGSRQLLTKADQADFNKLKVTVSRTDFDDTAHSAAFHYVEKRRREYNPKKWLTGNQEWDVRFVGPTDVDWFLERDVVVVPKDFYTVEMFERLVKRAPGIWNVARKVEDVKFTNEFWQNILILG